MITPPFNLIEQKIVDALTQFAIVSEKAILRGDGNWTKGIKDVLISLGKGEHVKICTSGFKDEYEDEWLYDMVWYRENDQKQLISVPLVMESEWRTSFKAIKYDFEKLLLANAEHRLMICQWHPFKRAELLDYFRTSIPIYTLGRSGDRFLIAILNTHTLEFDFELLVRT